MTELDAIAIFINDCGIGSGAWMMDSAKCCAKTSLFKKPFKGLGTRCIGWVNHSDGFVTAYTSSTSKIFSGDLADPKFFEKFKKALNVLS